MSMILHDVKEVPEGDGVDVKRLFPIPGRMNFDPFVLWDHFDIAPGRGFPEHPHRGFEAITYMFSGGMQHKDNLGNESFVQAGGAQRFTAGAGIVHSEMPAETGRSNGIQLWINLTGKLKKIEPSYQQVNDGEFPLQQQDGLSIKTLVGEGSPLHLNTEVVYQAIDLESTAHSIAVPQGMRGIIYVTRGTLQVNSQAVSADQAVFFEDETELSLNCSAEASIMLCMGKPHGEPIRQYGPFVD